MCKCAATIYEAQFDSTSLNCSEPMESAVMTPGIIQHHIFSQWCHGCTRAIISWKCLFPALFMLEECCYDSLFSFSSSVRLLGLRIQWRRFTTGLWEAGYHRQTVCWSQTANAHSQPWVQETSQKKWSCRNSWPEKDSRSGILECFHFIPSWEML